MLLNDKRELLGTLIEISIVGNDLTLAQEFLSKSFTEIERIEKKFSRFLRHNDLDCLNSKLDTWQKVDSEFLELLKFAEKMYRDTQGYFDVSVKKILESWGYGNKYSVEINPPTPFVKGAFSSKPLEIDCKTQRVKLNRQIDLGGIGKGYALDRVADILKNFENVFVNAGGDIFVKGLDGKGNKWKVFFENPLNTTEIIGEIEIASQLFLASSAANKRKWQNKHHLVNPINFIPANDMLGVFTQGNSGILSDTYSTALFVMGYDRAKEFLKNFKQIEAMLISKNGKICRTDGFLANLYMQT